ncbi:MAG: GtrA family protein, partial [Bacilli bacterium]|nr:GtrA family protein [Bacilli bacterium]
MINLYKKYKEIINYLIFGVLTTVVSLATYYLLVFTILDPNNPLELQIANIISWITCVTFAYITNRKYVFNSKNKNIL